MVGMIVTGHGKFATGITTGLSLLAGEPQNYMAVDFGTEDSIDSLTEKLENAVSQLDECNGILIYADLIGGSPFNVSIRMKLEQPEKKIEVIGGANLPAVLEGYMSRMMEDDVLELAKNSLGAGKNAMVQYVPSSTEDEDYEE